MSTLGTIQSGLKEAIEDAHADDPFPLDVSVRIGDTTTDVKLTEDDAADVFIGFQSVAGLAQSSSRVLEQFLIPVVVRSRNISQTDQRRDDLNDLMERIRDVLSAYAVAADTDIPAQRVEQILTPNPFDVAAMVTPGVWDSRLMLDLDIVRRLTTITAPTVSDSPKLSAIRGAVWDSIDNWEPFAAVVDPPRAAAWLRKFKSAEDVEELALHDPGFADLPAISVSWGNIGENWWTHREQKWPASLNVVFWLPADQIAIAEWRSQQIVECLYRATADGAPKTYLKTATGYPPEKYSQTIEAVELGRGQLKALRGTIAFTLPASFQPY